MGKTKLAVQLAAAYAAGLVLLLALALSLPCETQTRVRTVLARMPAAGQRAVQLVRLAAHAGALGVKHLPALLEPQGATPRHRALRYCSREPQAGCGSSLSLPPGQLWPAMPVRFPPAQVWPVVHVFVDDT